MMAFNHKKDAIKEIYTVFMLFVHLNIEFEMIAI